MNYIQPIKKDELILFSSGQYSDYTVSGMCLALRDIDVSSVRDKYIELYPGQMAKYAFKDHMFLDYLKSEGYIKLIPFKELYMGGYSSIDSMRVTDGFVLFT